MPTITFRIDEGEKRELVREAHAQGLPVSELVRKSLGLRDEAQGLSERVEDLDRRVSLLERVAGVQ